MQCVRYHFSILAPISKLQSNVTHSQALLDPSRLRMGQETLVSSSCRSGMYTTQ